MLAFIFAYVFLFTTAWTQCPPDTTPVGPCIDPTSPNCSPDGNMCAPTNSNTSTNTSNPNVTNTTSGNTTTTTIPNVCEDLVNPSTGISDCTALSHLCSDSIYFDVMTKQCPKTCKRCGTSPTQIPPSNCTDLVNPKTGKSDCPRQRHLCNDSNYREMMKVQCALTCGFCSGSGSTTKAPQICEDRKNPNIGISDCSRNVDLCRRKEYVGFMKTECPKTCGYC